MKFSVITISYNAENDIRRTIESIKRQNFYDMEYIFVDAKSTDGTNEIIEEYRDFFEKNGVNFIHHSEPDKGISDGFRKGINFSSGEIIVILNSGDEMLPNTLNYLNEKFDDSIDVLYGNIIWNDDNRNLQYTKKSVDTNKLNKLKYKMVVQHPATYIRKSAYEKYGNYDVSYKYAMDTELLLRMYMLGARFKYINKEFTYFKAGGVSDSNLSSVLKENERIAKEAGENKIKIKIMIIYRRIYHHLSHFIRFNIIRWIK